MQDRSQHLDRLEADLHGQGHSKADLEWARDAYVRLLLSRVKSSPAQGEVRRAAASAREAGQSTTEAHGTSGAWAASVARGWASSAPERFAPPRGALEPSWSLRSAAWGVPALAAACAAAFALMGLIPGWGQEPVTLGWVLLPGLLAVPVVAVHAIYSAVLIRFGNTRAVAAAVASTVLSALAIGWAVTWALTAPLPAGMAWEWLSVAGYVVLAILAWMLARVVPGRGTGRAPEVRIRVHESQDPVDDLSWEQQFRAALYQRGVRRDRDVERAVQEALGQTRATGLLAVEKFGSPWEYAWSLAEDPVVAPRRSTLFYAALTVLWIGLSVLHLLDPTSEPTWGHWLFRGAAVVLLGLATALRARQWCRASRRAAEP